MFNYRNLTDFEKLLFAEKHIEELKKSYEIQKRLTETAQMKLKKFISEVKEYSEHGRKLMVYKKDQIRREAKIREYKSMIEKLKKNTKSEKQINKEKEELIREFYNDFCSGTGNEMELENWLTSKI